MEHLPRYYTLWCIFQFVTGITFSWEGVMWWIVAIFVWIGLWNQLRIYMVPTDLIKLFDGFGSNWGSIECLQTL